MTFTDAGVYTYEGHRHRRWRAGRQRRLGAGRGDRAGREHRAQRRHRGLARDSKSSSASTGPSPFRSTGPCRTTARAARTVSTYLWEKLRGPDGDTIATPDAATTDVTIVAEGPYRYRLTVDDGGPENNTGNAFVDVTVSGVPGTPFVRGDADSSGVIDLTDGVVVLNFLFLGGPQPACGDAADADDTGEHNITDAIFVLNWLFLGGEAPPEPTPSTGGYPAEDCGLDPTKDALGCDTTGCQ